LTPLSESNFAPGEIERMRALFIKQGVTKCAAQVWRTSDGEFIKVAPFEIQALAAAGNWSVARAARVARHNETKAAARVVKTVRRDVAPEVEARAWELIMCGLSELEAADLIRSEFPATNPRQLIPIAKVLMSIRVRMGHDRRVNHIAFATRPVFRLDGRTRPVPHALRDYPVKG
jgi:hypothetical protein